MLGFIKIFLQGLLYVVTLPLILLILALYGVYCIFVFIYIAIRSIVVFFMGGTPLGDLPEDVEAKRILMQRAAATPENSTQALAEAITQSQMQIMQSFYAQQNQQQNEPVQPQDNFVTENSQDSEENKIEDMDDGVSY